MITLRLGGLAIRIDTEALAGGLDDALPAFISQSGAAGASGQMTPEEQVLRLACSKLAQLLCWYMRRQMPKVRPGYPLPQVPPRADPLAYTIRYVAALFLTELEAREWMCAYVERAGEIQITGLAAGPAWTGATGSGDAPIGDPATGLATTGAVAAIAAPAGDGAISNTGAGVATGP